MALTLAEKPFKLERRFLGLKAGFDFVAPSVNGGFHFLHRQQRVGCTQ